MSSAIAVAISALALRVLWQRPAWLLALGVALAALLIGVCQRTGHRSGLALGCLSWAQVFGSATSIMTSLRRRNGSEKGEL